MYCPTCSTKSADGAKFCKSCGMNLSVVTQALSGGVVISDPVRDREYKRARKQVSEGIQGTAIGAGLLVGAGLLYSLVAGKPGYVIALALALVGVIKLFKSIGTIIDAKVGTKLVDNAVPPRTTGSLSASQPLSPPAINRNSQRLQPDAVKPSIHAQPTRPVNGNENLNPALDAPAHFATGRINREHSTPLKRRDKDEEMISNLRN